MTNQEFWISINAIIHDGFTDNGLKILTDYVQAFNSRRLLFSRYSANEQRGCTDGGTLHVVATILAAAETPTDQLSAPEGSFKRERERAEAQAAVIERWARTVGCWVDDVEHTFARTFGEQLTEGGEAHVYDNGNTLVKHIGLDYYIQPLFALDRITLHNTLFPSTHLIVLGFGRTSEGDFQILVQQPFIQGSRMSDEEIRAYAESLGFRLINPRNWTYATPDIYLSDLHDENVIRSPRDNVFVIDCDIRINTSELRCGGIRSLTTEVELLIE